MATDWWPEQNGRLTDGLTIMCNCEGSSTEGAAQKFGTSTASQIRVQDGSAKGDGFGIALKTVSVAGDAVPVLVFGLWKSTVVDASITQGQFVVSNSTPTQVTLAPTTTSDYVAFGGADYMLGMVMQSGTATQDKCVLFVGRAL